MNLLLLDDLAALEELAEMLCSFDLALVWTHLVNLWIERLDAAVECLKRHCADLVSPVRQTLCLDE